MLLRLIPQQLLRLLLRLLERLLQQLLRLVSRRLRTDALLIVRHVKHFRSEPSAATDTL